MAFSMLGSNREAMFGMLKCTILLLPLLLRRSQCTWLGSGMLRGWSGGSEKWQIDPQGGKSRGKCSSVC